MIQPCHSSTIVVVNVATFHHQCLGSPTTTEGLELQREPLLHCHRVAVEGPNILRFGPFMCSRCGGRPRGDDGEPLVVARRQENLT